MLDRKHETMETSLILTDEAVYARLSQDGFDLETMIQQFKNEQNEDHHAQFLITQTTVLKNRLEWIECFQQDVTFLTTDENTARIFNRIFSQRFMKNEV